MNGSFSVGANRVLVSEVPAWEKWVPRLIKELDSNRHEIKHSHKIRGRWENSYLAENFVPTVREPIRFARDLGKKDLKINSVALFEPLSFSNSPYPPFWFNLSRPGQETGLHDHVSSAVLSAVVYLSSGEDSGNLYFKTDAGEEFEVPPRVGRVVVFSPALKHGVRKNNSLSERVSLAFNLYPFPLPYDLL